jgi:hypothetical protein
LYLPNAAEIERLEKANVLPSAKEGYRRFDCLEQRADMEALFDLLRSFSDIHGNPARITFNTVMGNPDFEKIQQSGFQHYHFQHFFDSYVQYNAEDCRDLWTAGRTARLIVPQFHAREHINVPAWMGDLQIERQDTRIAFENHYYCQIRSKISPISYLAAHWPECPDHLPEIEQITVDGLKLFEETFGFKSETFIACCYVMPEEVECLTAKHGVKLLQTQRRHRVPDVQRKTSHYTTRYSGQKNRWGQTYSLRNVVFEPASDESLDWVDLAYRQIADAFRRRVPAVVSTHRVNFVGGRVLENRERTLRMLGALLRKVTQEFSDVEFISSDELLSAVLGDKPAGTGD